MRINPRHLVLAGALAAFALAACGSDEPTTATTEITATTGSVAPTTTSVAATTTTTAVAATTVADETTTTVDASTTTIGGPMTLQVDAIDYQFQNLPAEITAGPRSASPTR